MEHPLCKPSSSCLPGRYLHNTATPIASTHRSNSILVKMVRVDPQLAIVGNLHRSEQCDSRLLAQMLQIPHARCSRSDGTIANNNDKGANAGNYIDKNKASHGFLWTP